MPQPFIKFYFRDWEADVQLMACSLAAQGLWIRMMRVMHEADPYGFFVGRAGEAIDLMAFAKRIGSTGREVRALIGELERENVFNRDGQGRIYSRRMVRDHARSLQGAEFGRSGGNPSLKPTDNAAVNPTRDNPQVNQGRVNQNSVNPRGDKGGDNASRASIARTDPEARIQSTDSLRSSAQAFGDWPEDIPHLRELALIFVAEFANCRDAIKAEKHVGAYTSVLATMRSRGMGIAVAWQACVDAREACGGKPLWGASVRTAISFLPARPSNVVSINARPSEDLSNKTSDDLHRETRDAIRRMQGGNA